ncbi:hypothetical protein ACKI1Q_27330 [Streptomyces galilaeus]|uniref:hypothetical protein n=1 Tax=Streptomyces TaxID=1883 RepID=UPI003801A0FE
MASGPSRWAPTGRASPTPDGRRVYVGSGPLGAAAAPDSRRVYVTNVGANTVSVIGDTVTYRVAETVAAGSNCWALATAPDGRRVYVANAGKFGPTLTSSVSAIDTATGQVVLTTAVDTRVALAAAPDMKHAYAAGVQSVFVIDTTRGQLTATVQVGGPPPGWRSPPDGRRLYITVVVAGSVSVIDTGTNQVLRTVTVGKNPTAVAAAPDGRHVYVTNAGSNDVSVIATDNDQVLTTIPVDDNPLEVAVARTVATSTSPTWPRGLCR